MVILWTSCFISLKILCISLLLIIVVEGVPLCSDSYYFTKIDCEEPKEELLKEISDQHLQLLLAAKDIASHT
jgi:hypothetical protein